MMQGNKPRPMAVLNFGNSRISAALLEGSTVIERQGAPAGEPQEWPALRESARYEIPRGQARSLVRGIERA